MTATRRNDDASHEVERPEGARPARGRSTSGETAVDRESNAYHEAGARTTEPEDGCGDLVRTAHSPDRLLIPHSLFHSVSLPFKHGRDPGGYRWSPGTRR